VTTGQDHTAPSAPRESKHDLARDRLLEMRDGLSVGAAIPSERRLVEQLGVSRPTLRAVIDELVREHLLERRHGSGTYVTEPQIALPLTMTSFSEDMARRGLRASSRLLSFETKTAGAKLAQPLRVSPTTPIFAVTRLRLADDVPMAIEFLHVPQDVAPGLSAADLEAGSFYALLEARHGTVVAAGTQTIEPTVTNETEARVLDVPEHAPAFLFERVTTAEDGRVVEFVRSIYRGDRYRLVTELRPPLRGHARP
jgi:GntR family transcriptional regulator